MDRWDHGEKGGIWSETKTRTGEPRWGQGETKARTNADFPRTRQGLGTRVLEDTPGLWTCPRGHRLKTKEYNPAYLSCSGPTGRIIIQLRGGKQFYKCYCRSIKWCIRNTRFGQKRGICFSSTFSKTEADRHFIINFPASILTLESDTGRYKLTERLAKVRLKC